MVTSSSVTAASTADGWGGGVTTGVGGAGTVDASTGIEGRDGAGDGVAAFSCTSIGGVIAIFADTDSGAAPGDEGGVITKTASGAAVGDGVGTGARVEIAGAIPVVAEPDSGVAAGDAVDCFAGGVVPVFTETGCGGRVRVSPRNEVNASSGLRADVDPEDELDVFARAATGGADPFLAGRGEGVAVSAGLRLGFEADGELEVVACAMTGAAAPFLPETAPGGGDLSGAAAAGAPAGRRRLAPMAGIGPGINVGAGPRG